MKTKPDIVLRPLRSPQGGGVLDWPREAGSDAVEQFIEKVEFRRKQHRSKRRAKIVSTTAGVLLMAVGLLWGIPYARDTSSVEVPAAQRQTLVLSDGSTAELNARTHLHTDFRYGRRIVRMEQGEAFFIVRKDQEHPFLVETPTGTVRVTGTEFNVRVTAGGAAVTLFHGGVVLEAGDARQDSERASVRLAPGEQFDPRNDGVRELSVNELNNVVAWRRGQFSFDELSLGEVAARIGTYHGCVVSVASELAHLKARGSYPVDDLPALLQAIESVLEVRVQGQSDGGYRIVKR